MTMTFRVCMYSVSIFYLDKGLRSSNIRQVYDNHPPCPQDYLSDRTITTR